MPEKKKADRDLEEGEDGGRAPSKRGDLMKNIFPPLRNKHNRLKKKHVSHQNVLSLSTSGSLSQRSIVKLCKAASVPNSWTFCTSVHPERLHSTTAHRLFAFYFKHTRSNAHIGAPRGSAFCQEFQRIIRTGGIFFSSIYSGKGGPYHRFLHYFLTL